MFTTSRRSLALAINLTLVVACSPQVRDFSAAAEGSGATGAGTSGAASGSGPGGSSGSGGAGEGGGSGGAGQGGAGQGGAGAGEGAAGGHGGAGEGGGTGATSASSSASTGPCMSHEDVCDGQCVDLQRSPYHCGACGHDCQGGACGAGQCEPVELTRGASDVFDIAVGPMAVFWTAKMRGDVLSVPLEGGRPTPLASGQQNPERIAVDQSGVYWSTILVPDATIKVLPRGLMEEKILHQGSHKVNDFVLHRGAIYWADYADGSGHVSSLAISGGRVATYASGAMNPRGIAVDDNNVYWTNNYGGDTGVRKHGLASGTTTVLADRQPFPFAIAVDERNVYWSNLDDGTLMSVPIAGGTPKPIATGQGRILGIALDESGIYWIDSTNATVMALRRGSSTPIALAAKQMNPSGIAVDATSIYWGTNDAGSGAVMKLAK